MNRRTKLATISILSLLTGVTTMALYHSFGPVPSFPTPPGFNGMSPVTEMRNGMGWMMLFGPLAILLTFGGFVTLTVLLITSLTQSPAKPD
jgi:hypothetical protein